MVIVSFFIGAIIALAYPSRGGIIEYMTQAYGEGYFSGSLVFSSFGAAFFAILYSSKSMPHIIYYIICIFFIAFLFEFGLRLFSSRTIKKQIAKL